MKNIIPYILALSTFACCQNNENKDNDYFNGEIRYFDTNSHIVKSVTSKDVLAENYAHGMFAVYDSLAVFWNPKFPEYIFGIFNIDTGKEINYFCRRGKGPEEFSDIYPTFQLFKKEGDLMTLLYAFNEKKIFFWNISQSIKEGITVYDTIVPYYNETKSPIKNSRFDYMFYQTGDRLLAKVAAVPLSRNEATPPYYEQRTMYANKLVHDYRIYTDTVRNEIAEISPDDFFYSIDAIKPDGSKIVQSMRLLPQINILDTNTGEVVGCRMQNSPGFSLFETKMDKYNIYYISVQADDNYIYATYWGKKQWEVDKDGNIPLFNTIYVFDWSGKLISELKPDRSFLRISLDEVRNRLYTADLITDEIYYLDLNEANLFVSLQND